MADAPTPEAMAAEVYPLDTARLVPLRAAFAAGVRAERERHQAAILARPPLPLRVRFVASTADDEALVLTLSPLNQAGADMIAQIESDGGAAEVLCGLAPEQAPSGAPCEATSRGPETAPQPMPMRLVVRQSATPVDWNDPRRVLLRDTAYAFGALGFSALGAELICATLGPDEELLKTLREIDVDDLSRLSPSLIHRITDATMEAPHG